MPFCSSCGSQVAEGVAFCPSCGAPIQKASPPAAAAPPPQAPPMAPQYPAGGYGQQPTYAPPPGYAAPPGYAKYACVSLKEYPQAFAWVLVNSMLRAPGADPVRTAIVTPNCRCRSRGEPASRCCPPTPAARPACTAATPQASPAILRRRATAKTSSSSTSCSR